MYYYDKDGDIAWTTDAQAASRHHILTMLRANKYPSNPDAVGQLYKALGPAPINVSREIAMSQIRRVMRELGLTGISLTEVLEYVDDSWALAVKVGE